MDGCASEIRKNNTCAGWIPVVILCLLIVITETPILARNMPNPVYYGLVFLFFVFSAEMFERMSLAKLQTLLLLIAYFLMQFAYKLLGISTTALAYYSTIAKFFFFMTAMLILGGQLSRKQQKLLAAVICLSMSFTIADNIRLYFIYGPARFIHLFQTARFTTNSINTAFAASELFLSGAMIICFMHSRTLLIRAASISFAALNLLFIAVFAQRMILVLLALVMVPLLVMSGVKDGGGRFAVVYLLALLVLVAAVNYELLLRTIASLVGSARMRLRIEQIIALLNTRNFSKAGGSLTAHFELIFTSVRTWFSSPRAFLFGSGDHRETNLIIGNHSEFLDECARYGLMGMCIWIPLTACCLREIFRLSGARRGTVLGRQVQVLLMIYVLRCFLGSIYEASIAVQMFFMIPLTCGMFTGAEGLRNREESPEDPPWGIGAGVPRDLRNQEVL